MPSSPLTPLRWLPPPSLWLVLLLYFLFSFFVPVVVGRMNCANWIWIIKFLILLGMNKATVFFREHSINLVGSEKDEPLCFLFHYTQPKMCISLSSSLSLKHTHTHSLVTSLSFCYCLFSTFLVLNLNLRSHTDTKYSPISIFLSVCTYNNSSHHFIIGTIITVYTTHLLFIRPNPLPP